MISALVSLGAAFYGLGVYRAAAGDWTSAAVLFAVGTAYWLYPVRSR